MTQTQTQAQACQTDVMSLDEFVGLLKPGMVVRGLFGNDSNKVALGRLDRQNAENEVYRFSSILARSYATQSELEASVRNSRYELQKLTEPQQTDEVWYRIK